jgi:hypothetical protein
MKPIFLILFLSTFNLNAQTLNLSFEQSDEFFKKNVSKDGLLDYKSLKKSPGKLFYILDQASKLNVENIDAINSKTFCINVYNLQVIRFVIENYKIDPVQSILNFFSAKKFIVGNIEVTLDKIQHEILREKKINPGFHFVLSSAAIGGAKLLNNAYLPNKINIQIENQIKERINYTNFYIINREEKIIYLNQIFEWYKKEFDLLFPNIIDFLNLFSNEKIKKEYTIKYYEFDWALNDLNK